MTGIDGKMDLLGDDGAIQILLSLDEPKTVPQITEEVDISRSTVYRIIEDMEDANLVENVERKLTPNNRVADYYIRSMNRIQIDIQNNDMSMEGKPLYWYKDAT